MVMDFLRAGYSTDARFYQDSTALGRIIWYRAPANAKVFPYEHAFGSTVWEGDHRTEFPGAGEIGRDRGWSRTVGPPFPGDHFEGKPEWFLTGIPPGEEVPLTPRVCGMGWISATGGGAGGGVSPQTGGQAVIGHGGGAGGGRALQAGGPSVQMARGGGAGGGSSAARALHARGGGAGGGQAVQSGLPWALIARGGGAGGGVAEQTAEDTITTTCCPGNPLPLTMYLTFDADSACNPQAGTTMPVVWQGTTPMWVGDTITLSGFNYKPALECSAIFAAWRVHLLNPTTGGIVLTFTPTFTQCDPFLVEATIGPFGGTCPVTFHT
jgi:hypothetical protein